MQTRLTVCLFLALAAPAICQTSQPVATRSAALNTLFKDVWEDDLKRSPEFASALGDRRYNDQLSDLSPKAFNDALARHRDFLARLLAIDTTGLPEPTRLSAELLQREFIEGEQAARLKGWELPISQSHGIHTDLPAMVVNLPFDTVKDYDDYIARLHKIPATLRQASENLLSGIDDHRVQPASILEKALAQTEELASQTPEASPFALPLKRFPSSIPAADRKRISADLLEVIETDVLPAYVRFAKFLKVVEIPAAPKDPSVKEILVGNSGNFMGFTPRQLKILELRAMAESALSPKFNLEGFRQTVENYSALPLELLEHRVIDWIAEDR
jgi:uncharacterized protein (DUF885 family)